MTQIFISYSRSERATAARLAERLTEAGPSVWWDVELVGGQQFESEIQGALRAAKAVIVLWSKASVASDWVRAEAEVARVARTAVPVLIDDVSVDELPMVFRALHTVDLRKWNGDPAAAGFQDILGAVAKLGAIAGSPRPQNASHYPQPTPPGRRRWLFVAVAAALLLLIVGGVGWWFLRPVSGCDQSKRVALGEVPLQFCLLGDWAPVPQADALQYRSGDNKVQLRIVADASELNVKQFRDAIVSNAQKIAGDPSYIAVVKDGQLTVGGAPWRFIEFTSQGKTAFVNFYFSNPGFGSVQVLFVSSVADVPERNALATPILKTIQVSKN